MVAAGLLLVGCGRPLELDEAKVAPAPADADQAIAAVADMYGMSFVPTVHFYAGEADCDGGFMEYGDCYDGATSDDGTLVIVRVPPDGITLGNDIDGVPGDATLAHELWHAASVQRGEGPDQDHRGHGFAPGGEVAQATAMLVAAGL
jgi:hypothetical protein